MGEVIEFPISGEKQKDSERHLLALTIKDIEDPDEPLKTLVLTREHAKGLMSIIEKWLDETPDDLPA